MARKNAKADTRKPSVRTVAGKGKPKPKAKKTSRPGGKRPKTPADVSRASRVRSTSRRTGALTVFPFGQPAHSCELDVDPAELADYMLALIDESPDKLALIRMPAHDDLDDLDAIEARFIAGYDVAKAKRPNLSVKLLHALDPVAPTGSRVLVAVHEHKWVGGQCVNGCPDTRKEG